MTVIITGSSFGSNCPTFQFPSVFAVSTYMTNACTDATVTLSFTTSGAGSGGLVLNSGGYGGQGFEPVTMGGLKSATVQAQSNLPASLSWLPWDILSTPQAAGSPVGGTFSFLQTNLNSGDATVLRFAPGEPATANPIGLSLLDPAASGGNTTAGALSSFTLTYQAPSRNLTKASGTFKVATFGISCYISTSENDYWNGSSCSTLTAYGVTLSGTATPPGLSGSYCQAFLDEVLINGSGVSRSGQDIASPPRRPLHREPEQLGPRLCAN